MSEAHDKQFLSLVFSLHGAAMYQIGKTVSPISGKIERDLVQAKQSIDMLEMLQRKTSGNLTPDEKRMLDHFLYELRLNYVDEMKVEMKNAGNVSPAESIKPEQ